MQMLNQDSYQDSKIYKLVQYFKDCPLLKDGKMGVDRLGENATEYSINPVLNASPVVTKYTDGGALKQYPFYFQSTEIYSQDIIDTMKNTGFYEQFETWIENQNDIGNLPDIKGIQKIEALSNGYLFSADRTIAQYQIQCRILYEVD